VPEQCQIRANEGNLARRTEDTEMNRLAFAAAIAAIDATAPTYAAKIPVLIHQQLTFGNLAVTWRIGSKLEFSSFPRSSLSGAGQL
jgi:hypothetical protein